MTAEQFILPISLRGPKQDSLASHNPDELVAAYQQMVLRTAHRLLGNVEDAQDAAQEVFMRLFRHQGGLRSEPRAWLYRVTVNVCNDCYRRTRYSDIERIPETAASTPDPERQLALKERKQLLLEGLQLLAPRERACVVLRDIEGLSTAEVADILGIEEVTVRGQIHSARVKLAKYVRKSAQARGPSCAGGKAR